MLFTFLLVHTLDPSHTIASTEHQCQSLGGVDEGGVDEGWMNMRREERRGVMITPYDGVIQQK